MERRGFFAAVAAAGVLALTGCTPGRTDASGTTPSASPTPTPTPTPRPTPTTVAAPAPVVAKVPIPGGVIYSLPDADDGHNLMAWTVDDGVNSQVVADYAQFAKDSGVRLTFFANAVNKSWTDNAPALRPLVDSGQVQIGNHTYSHADLTSLSDSGIVEELQKNDQILSNLYGRTTAPFYRPPYGYTNHRTERVAAGIGYTAPTMWYGSLSDSGLITPQQVVGFAQKWFLAGHIVIGHANYLPVTTVYPQLLDILHERKLQTVTMNDVFATATA